MAPQEKISTENETCDDYIGSIPFQAGRHLASPDPGEEIVITGLAGKYPDSHNVYHFRDNLFTKTDMVSCDNRRWEPTHPEIPQRTGKLYDVDKFDAGFFGIHYRQAEAMDPISRLLLERAVEAILDSGHHPSELAGTRTGVFVGACFSESEKTWFFDNQKAQQFSITGNERSMIANRISYALKLCGPSFITDTACSSSLYALDQAYKAIRNGTCDMAIVGGANVCLHPFVSLQFARLGVLSLDGTCKVFDDGANGYARSEAIVAIFLQKSKDARRIYAQVVHSKTNCDGFKPQSITYPSGEVQKKLLEEFYAECDVDVKDISYLEAHGTGTRVGDPEELQAIDEVFCQKRKTPLLIGSVKSNIGHSEPSSGLCSISKAIIGMETGYIPPNIHFSKPRAGIEALEKGRMKVVTEKLPFADNNGLIGVNSFGFGGGNAHVLLKWTQKTKVNKGLPVDNLPRLVCFSGRVEEAIGALQNDLAGRSLDEEYVRLYHQIFRKNIDAHLYRGFIVVGKGGEVSRSCAFYPQKKKALYLGLTGLGESWSGIARRLSVLPLFQTQLQRIQEILAKKGFNLLDAIANPKKDTLTLALGTLSVQLALVATLKMLQIDFDGYFGQGVSELICAYLDGALSLEETLAQAYQSPSTVSKISERSPKWINLIKDTTKLPLQRKSVVLFLGEELAALPKNTSQLVLDRNSDLNSFLELIGHLYENGHDVSCDVLYPKVEFPVSRGTPMISPLIKWDHRHSWFVTFYEHQGVMKCGERSVSLSTKDDDWVYLTGHLIDGRNLFPATGYLMLAWEALSKVTGMMISDMQVVFENVKFLRATTIPRENKVELTVMVQRGTGNFEVIEGGNAIVTGRIKEFTKGREEQVSFALPLPVSSEQWMPMNSKDIYKELRLRGYNYKGVFRQMQECDNSATVAKIKWDGNWVSFMDNMLQMKILQIDTRYLYVPTGIRRLSVDAKEHISFAQKFGENPDLPVYIHRYSDIIKCGSIEIRGLMANSIARRKQRGDPVLEKYVFVPHETNLGLEEAARVVMQLALENLPGVKVKGVELIDEATEDHAEILSPIIHSVLGDLPLIQPALTVLSKKELEVSNVTVEDKKLIAETDSNIVVGSKLLQRVMILNQAFGAVKENGYVLSREPLDFTPKESNLSGIDILAIYTTPTEKLYMIRKNFEFKSPTVIDVSEVTDEFKWLPALQKAILSDANVVVLAQNQPTSGILGLVNCIRREPSCTHVKMVFTQGEAPPFDLNNPFYFNELKKNLAINIYKNGQWGSYRHLVLNSQAFVKSEHIFCSAHQKGDLSSLKWMEGPIRIDSVLPPEKELVSIYFCALNFRDVMTASGRISADVITRDRTLQEFIIGFEYSGRTKTGKRVMGISLGSLATYIAADKYLTWPVPEFWTMEDATTVPVVYATVLYAFFVQVSIKKGESVLIHAGSGGVGQAAINICLYHGLTVYTTVGTQEKRDFIKKTFPQLTDRQIGNSRDTTFEQMIFTETKGRGVDYVLNSLSEEKLIASVRCLAYGGNFLEIGKFDLANNNPLRLSLLEKDATFHGVMVDSVFSMDPKGKLEIFRLMTSGIQSGAIKPLIRTIFKHEEVEQAFRFMAGGKHIGKVLIKMRDEEKELQAPPKHQTFLGLSRYISDGEKVHVIVGGLGGFGLELADWLVVRGARKLVLTSRKGISNGYQAFRIRTWEKYGTRTHISTADVTTREGCEQLIQEAQQFGGEIESIFNLAVVLKDALLENQTVEQFKASLEPKAFATAYLDEITREQCPSLRDFIVFSSVSCGRGNSGQTNYGMANSIMERICEKRKEDGLPGLAIQWGAVGDVGLVAEMQEENTELEIGGTLQQRIFSCLQVLDALLRQDSAVVSSMVVAEKRAGAGGTDNIVDAVAGILGLGDLKTVSLHASLSELGMDSMTAVEIKQTLEREYEVFLTPQDIRTLTFARLQEIQEERDSETETAKKDRPIGGFEMIVRHMNDETTSKIEALPLQSKLEEVSGEGVPHVIFFPGIEGVAKVLDGLAMNVSARIDSVQYLYENQPETIEEMAVGLLPKVEELLKGSQKKFIIVGYSFGAVVGLEVVSLLEAKGYSGTFISIDGSVDMLGKLLKNSLDMKSEAVFETAFLSQLMTLHTSIESVLKVKDKMLACIGFDERLNIAEEIMPKDTVHSTGYLRSFSKALFMRLKALDRYEPKYGKLKSCIKLFKPHNVSIAGVSEDYQLSDFAEGEVEVKVFKGNHVTILDNLEMADTINGLIGAAAPSVFAKEALIGDGGGKMQMPNVEVKQI